MLQNTSEYPFTGVFEKIFSKTTAQILHKSRQLTPTGLENLSSRFCPPAANP